MRKVLTLLALLCTLTTVQAADFGADKHVQKGVQCVICHGADMNKPKEPTDKVCLQCHPREQLIEKTKHLNKPVNPHNLSHNGECILCHRMHEAPVNNCAECHK
ncbi:cytochrome c3 family protein [Turicimonas muris]|uniref:cytochrome c3 family protein n=1 Tax=Turicimonas muris TaxID=1796652 RepID=UPI00248D3ABF|nr:cytochrome c3 family protein [Turicimonas muris]